MATVKEDLAPLVAEAALALRGHLQFMEQQFAVTGLPAPTLKRAQGAARPAAASPAVAAARPASPAAPVATPAPARTGPPPASVALGREAPPPTTGREMMPWERYTSAGAPPAPAPAVTPPRPPAPALKPHAFAQPPATQAPPAPAVSPPPPSAPALVATGGLAAPVGAVMRGAAGLKLIQDEIGDCKRCKLHAGRTNLVYGVGNPEAEIVFVGEGPGADEDLQGEPFVGKAGELLTQMIKAMGYDRNQVYICNVVKCRPPNNRDPEPDEVATCGPYVVRQVLAVKPRVVVTLGKHAAHALLGVKTPITKLRGTWSTFQGIPLMPTFHPAYLLRDATQKKWAWEDLKAVLKQLGRTVPGRG